MRKGVNITFNLDDPRDERLYNIIMLKANKSLACKLWLDMLFKYLGYYIGDDYDEKRINTL